MRIILTISLYCLCISFANAQSSKYFKKVIGLGYPNFEVGGFVKSLPNEGYLTGQERFYQTGGADGLIVKTDLYGNVIFDTCFQDAISTVTIKSVTIKNGKYYFTGAKRINASTNFKSFLMSTDSLANILYENIIGDSIFSSFGYHINQTLDNGFVVAGTFYQLNQFYSGNLIQIDSTGSKIWDQIYNAPNINIALWVEALSDSNYIFTGITNHILGSGDIWIKNISYYGNEIWGKNYHFVGDFTTSGYCIKQNSKKEFVVCGSSGNSGVTDNPLILKTDSNGNEIWIKKILNQSGQNPSGELARVIILDDSTYIFCGSTLVGIGMGIHQMHLLKTDSSGNTIWSRRFTMNQTDETYGLDIDTTSDGGFILSGTINQSGDQNIFLVKTNCLGFINAPNADFSVLWNGSIATFYNLSDRADTCIYYFGDGDSAVVLLTDTTPVVHTYAGSGPYTPYLLAYACGEVDTLYQTIYTGINNEYELIEKSFTIFPNPAAEQITLSCIIPHHLSEVKLLITDLTGRVISSNQIQGNPRELEIDISYLNNGSYLVSLDHNGNILASRKLMVVR